MHLCLRATRRELVLFPGQAWGLWRRVPLRMAASEKEKRGGRGGDAPEEQQCSNAVKTRGRHKALVEEWLTG